MAERRNRTLLDMVRSMMSYENLPSNFWGYALEAAQHILNLVPSKAVPTTPKELWTGCKPSLGHVRIWGSPTHVLKRDPSKLETRSDVCLWVTLKVQKVIFFMILKTRRCLLAQMQDFWKRII